MLYIFDLGNVIVNIDFNRALGVWSKFSGTPLATLQQRFHLHDSVTQHEVGSLTDEQFAVELCDQLGINLGYQQFVEGWQAIFVGLNQDVLTVMARLRAQGDRVVILSNTNALHTHYWMQHFPEIAETCDQFYLSHLLGQRKPSREIYQEVLIKEDVTADQCVFFDDIRQNIDAACQLGINGVWVESPSDVVEYFSTKQND